MKNLFVFIFVILVSFNITPAQSLPELDKVKEIKLLESTRDDVRRILADYKLEADEENHYDSFSTKDAEIHVEYSEGNCEEFRTAGFKVSEWKVIYIVIEPKNSIKLKNTKINFLKYKKEKKYHDINDLYVYYDKEAGRIFTVQKQEIRTIEFVPPAKYYGLMCDEEKAKKLSATSSIFLDELKVRKGIISCPVPDISELNLSRTETIASCDSSDSNSKKCSDGVKLISVVVISSNPSNDVLTYNYKVSGGNIIGTGEKVLWDLSDVKPGTYTITAASDNGCGFCGKTMTKTVVVKECSDCKTNPKP